MTKIPEPQGYYEVVQTPEATNIRFETITDSGSFIPFHWHHALEMILLLQGCMELTLRQQTWQLQADDCFVIQADLLHATKCIHASRYILVQIPMDFLCRYVPDAEHMFFPWKPKDASREANACHNSLKALLKQMQHLEEAKPDGYLLSFNICLFRLLQLLYEKVGVTLTAPPRQPLLQNKERLETVFDYTLENYVKPISIREIAGCLSLQPEYFCRFFKKQMGITYLEFLNRVRLSRIYRDLLDTNEPLRQILETHGFTNYKLFRRMFQEQFHATPSQIREKRGQDPQS